MIANGSGHAGDCCCDLSSTAKMWWSQQLYDMMQIQVETVGAL
eukprot:CAMPEP_0172743990 /NCGR_PEP_ID=MMETSP1074-20121228/133899_1 /TAXON_ID=2916 /ORGANISM="Ceratium fusus, Strain PA161109" /LENGTH=42 /DNA_ID= /DNA_START= /DNA_END= /DNA_ORIENTATION=